MAIDAIIGTRIRDRRVDQGVRQADLAKLAGISASYLNLIEHNKRRIGGKLLLNIACALRVPPEQLSRGVNTNLLNKLHNAAANLSATVELTHIEDLAVRLPGWTALIVAQAQQLDVLHDRVQMLNDRITYDPELAESLHKVITAVTAVRSAASILVSGEMVDADWQARFHRNIYDDSIRLAESSETLIRYLDTPDTSGQPQTTPVDVVEAALAAVGYQIVALERSRSVSIPKIVKDMTPSGDVAADLMTRFLITYHSDATRMPLGQFGPAAREASYDPVALSLQFNAPVDAVLRRLSSLLTADGHPPMGVVVADASGAIIFRKEVGDFALPRIGPGCPLWPLFTAFGRPNQPIRAEVALPNAAEQRFLCYAIAIPVGVTGFDAPPVLHSTMLVIPDQVKGTTAPIPAGISCRICPRPGCAVRREQSAMC